MTVATIKFDGGARPNPGPAAIGYVIETNEQMTKEGKPIGEATNNEAEYKALIAALESAHEKGCTSIDIQGDSQLIVNQVQNNWNVNKPHLQALCTRAQTLLNKFEEFSIKQVPRKHNKAADELVDEVLG